MRNLRRRVFVFLAASLLVGGWLVSPTPAAAGCHTACYTVPAPDCYGCSYLLYSNIICIRRACGECWEVECWVALPSKGDTLASEGESALCQPQSPIESRVKVVRVEFLEDRS